MQTLSPQGNRLWCSSNLLPLCQPLLLVAIILVVAIQAAPAGESTAPNITIKDGVDFGPFLADMNRQVRRVWLCPKGTENVTVVVLVQFGAPGQAPTVRLRQSCGVTDADVAASNAVRSGSRGLKLPPGAHYSMEFQFTFDKNTAAGSSGAAFVSPAKAVKIDNVKKAIEEMHGFSMRFGASGRSDGKPDLEAIKRDEIAKALRVGGAESVQALAQELKSPNLSMRKNASFELVELGGGLGAPFSRGEKIDIKAAVPALIETLNDTDSEVRIWSMAALRSLGPAAKEALPALKQATKDKDEGIRTSAKATIVEIETGRTGLGR